MKRFQSLHCGVLLTLAAGLSLHATTNHFHMEKPAVGGIMPSVDITSITRTQGMAVHWKGWAGPYTVWQKDSANGTNWTAVGTTGGTSMNIPAHGDMGLFRVSEPPPAYSGYPDKVGDPICAYCHFVEAGDWAGTAHARALDSLTRIGMGNNASCQGCHTVGKGYSTGFIDTNMTPHLAGVQCENCHGPAQAHAANPRAVLPKVTLQSENCGGCHTDSHHPTYDEWETAGHAEVTEDVAGGSSGIVNPGTTGYNRQMSCGFCHSGATRMAMLYDIQDRKQGRTNNLALPDGTTAAEIGITCAVCHDPHSHANKAQLRNRTFSTNYYTLFTSYVSSNIVTTNAGIVTTNVIYRNDSFAAQYNPNMQICAQCHNSRGARWDGRSKTWNAASNAMVLGTSQSFARPPHHSPQYNLLIGIIQDDYFNTNTMGVATNYLQRHGTSRSGSGVYNTNQCATCHVVSYDKDPVTHVTGHSFQMNEKGCTISGCHGTLPNYELEQHHNTNRIAAVVALLNQWALAKGPALYGTANANRYKQNGWEYTTIGALASVTNTGPSSTDQAKMPNTIRQARFNLYMVLHDGSLGIHNPRYATALINDAETKVLGEFPVANFRASTVTGFAPLTVAFTNLGTGLTDVSWNFGDGNTSTSTNPTNIYTTPGVYTVTLTATSASGTETVSRTNYITVVQRPTVTFSAGPRTGYVPLTVSFTNTSYNTDDVTAWRWTVATGVNITTNAPVFEYTYLTPGTNNVSLRASTDAGNVTSTTNAFIIVRP